jgi:hypothetical protein
MCCHSKLERLGNEMCDDDNKLKIMTREELQKLTDAAKERGLEREKAELKERFDWLLHLSADAGDSSTIVWESSSRNCCKVTPGVKKHWWSKRGPDTHTLIDPIGKYAVELCKERDLDFKLKVYLSGNVTIIASWND